MITSIVRGATRLHVEVHPSDRTDLPLVLTHGFGSSAAMWEPNLPALARDRVVVTWDLRGHGRTSTPADPAGYSVTEAVHDLLSILDELGLERAILGGMSVGGYISLACRLEAPERVAGLVLVDTGPGFRHDAAREKWNARVLQIADGLDTHGLAALPPSVEAATSVRDPVGLALAARGLMLHHDDRIIESLPEVHVPALVVVGADDEPFLGAAEHMATAIPDAAKAVITGAAHASNVEQPAAFAEVVTAFLRRVDQHSAKGTASTSSSSTHTKSSSRFSTGIEQ